MSGSIPAGLGNLSNLSSLELANNQLSGPIPAELGNLLNLQYLALYNNHLSGPIPSELGNLSNLQYLVLYNNQLSGRIPPELGNLSKLQYLALYNNQLSGSIPRELGKVSNIGWLYLNNNQFSGPIPPELGNLHCLYLFLDHNKLSGIIPASIADNSDLSVLDVSNNQLSGAIPSSIADLKKLHTLNLSHNRFTFDGMELIVQTFPFAKYDLQMPIPLHVNNNTFSVSAGGTLSNNTYVWYQQDKPGNITIKGDSVSHPVESGTYFVKVRNKIATGLKLVSRAIKYTVPSAADAIALSKQQFINNNFSVYPNPAKNILHINANGNTSFSLMSEDGETLLTSHIDKAGVIDISNIAAGVYYLKNNNTNASKKIFVIK